MTLLAHQTDLEFPSIASGEAGTHSIPLVPASIDTLQGYGEIVTDFAAHEVTIVPWPTSGWRPLHPGTGIEGGVTEGSFEMHREGQLLFSSNEAVSRSYITGWFDDPGTATIQGEPLRRDRFFIHKANYHPDGGQIWFPRDGGAFVAPLAKPGDNVTPADFVAFYFDGSFGLQIAPGVWHQPAVPVADRIVLDNKQGRVHACVDVDFLKEFGCYLEVPLTRP